RCERDLVLRRTAAGKDGDLQPAQAHGGPGVVVPPNLPTAIVTTVPGGACVPPPGSWVCTMPSWLGSVTGCGTIFTLKPEAFSCACAAFCERLCSRGA